jgi:hypothetical protein
LGKFAHIKGLKIDRSKHLVLESGHPSPMSANQGKWFGNKHFSKTNSYLKANGEKEIDWIFNNGSFNSVGYFFTHRRTDFFSKKENPLLKRISIGVRLYDLS